jgi:DNA-binding LacI/PurR family transcriptional regulator
MLKYLKKPTKFSTKFTKIRGPMKNKIKISDIAGKCGVSASTVSLVLNNKPGVSQETVTRVMEVAEELGYRIKPQATYTKSSHLTTIGMVVKTDLNALPQANPFYSKVMVGIEDGCRKKGINLLFSTLPVDEENHPLEALHYPGADIVDGLLIVGAFMDDETVISLTGKNSSLIVLVDGYSPDERYDQVVSDNFHAAYQAVEYLIQKGHRHIGLLGSNECCFPSLKERRNGYLRAMKENGLTETYVADFNMIKSQGYSEATALLTGHPEITALFCINDDVGSAAIKAIHDMGKRVPEDVSVIGYDDTYIAMNTHPGLTTMHVDTVAMGHAAVSLLSLRLENPDSARMTLTIHPTLVERDSVCTCNLS